MRRLIVTGANGAGKTHVARRASQTRPDAPLYCFDALKLRRTWVRRPRAEIDALLLEIVARDAWILEGGPTLLPIAAERADLVIWLDPPEWLRAWRLLLRPWKHIGRTRPELPPGNDDWPLAQYRFALRSLRNSRRFRETLDDRLGTLPQHRIRRCRTSADIEDALALWSAGDGAKK